MRKIWLTVATALMLIRGGYEIEKHYHVHYELPRWEILSDSAVRTSGDTSTGYPFLKQQRWS